MHSQAESVGVLNFYACKGAHTIEIVISMAHTLFTGQRERERVRKREREREREKKGSFTLAKSHVSHSGFTTLGFLGRYRYLDRLGPRHSA